MHVFVLSIDFRALLQFAACNPSSLIHFSICSTFVIVKFAHAKSSEWIPTRREIVSFYKFRNAPILFGMLFSRLLKFAYTLRRLSEPIRPSFEINAHICWIILIRIESIAISGQKIKRIKAHNFSSRIHIQWELFKCVQPLYPLSKRCCTLELVVSDFWRARDSSIILHSYSSAFGKYISA